MKKSIISSYLLFLGAIIGIEFAAGALIAPIIFYPAKFLGEGVLTHFQSGILMTQVFLRFNIILLVFIFLAWLFEAYMYKIGKKDLWTIGILVVISFCAYLFVFYYTPFIVNAQQLGAKGTTTPEFFSMHKQSEIDMKILMMLQITLLFKRVWSLIK